MKKFFNSKLFVGLICFCLGLLTNHFLSNITHRSTRDIAATSASTANANRSEERFPVNPDDFDHDKLMDAAQKMQQEMMAQADIQAPEVTGVERREDDHFVYYDIPLNAKEKNDHELKVNVKDGMISISENSKNSESMREFSIDPGLDEAKATVLNTADKISIKIPKMK